MYGKIDDAPLLQPKQSRVLLANEERQVAGQSIHTPRLNAKPKSCKTETGTGNERESQKGNRTS